MVIEISDAWDAAKKEHLKYTRNIISNWITTEENNINPSAIGIKILHFLKRNEKIITGGTADSLRKVIEDFEINFPEKDNRGNKNEDRGTAIRLLKSIFNYEKFSRETEGWGGYKLCKLSRYKVCPYCHINTTETHEKDNELAGYRPQLDHFFSKSKHPYLSLSIGNLIPACGQCNGPGMKHTKDFNSVPHLNPLSDREAISFKIRPKNNGNWTPMLRAMRMPSNHYEVIVEVEKGNKSAANSVKTFQLHPRYQEKVADAYRAAIATKTTGWKASIMRTLKINLNAETALGFKPNTNEYKNISCGKMMNDIFKSISG